MCSFIEGLVIDNKLLFDKHVEQVKKKVHVKSFLIYKTRSFFPISFRLTLHTLLILPHSDYCFTVYRSITRTRFDILVKFFHRALRFSLKIKISSRLDISEALSSFKPYQLLPLQPRLLGIFVSLLLNYSDQIGLVSY